jgi:hypothetical protein
MEYSQILTPARFVLNTLKQIWNADRIHGFPAVAEPSFFPLSLSWNLVIRPIGGKIVLMGLYGRPGKLDSEEANLTQTDKWLIWKTKDDIWTHNSKNAGFHQVFSTNKEIKSTAVYSKLKVGGKKMTSNHTKQKTFRMLG